jgi:uncharacterized protein (TIGR03067 family)
MYRFLLLGVMVSLVIAGRSLGEPPTAIPELRGKWMVVEGESSGKKLKTTGTWEFRDGRLYRKTSKSKTALGTIYQYTTDTSKNPKQIDLRVASATAKVMPGIYQMDGEFLKICYALGTKGDGKPRPTQFQTQPGDGYIMYVLKRTE